MKIESILTKGEEVVFQLKPAERFNYLPSISCMTFAILAFAFGWVALCGLLICGAFLALIVNICIWNSTDYVATNKRIMKISGIFNPSVKSAAIEKIQNFEAKTFFDLWGAGHILFDTAGGPLKEITWERISDPHGAYAKLSSIIHGG